MWRVYTLAAYYKHLNAQRGFRAFRQHSESNTYKYTHDTYNCTYTHAHYTRTVYIIHKSIE